jgi:hypothetical protein
MASVDSLILDVADPTAAARFCTAAFGLGTRVGLRAAEAPAAGFRGFAVSQPADVRGFIGAALDAGAAPLKPAAKSLWGYGGVVQAPDGTIWNVAASAEEDTGPAARQIGQIVLLLGAADVAAGRRFCAGRGLAVAKSSGHRYAEFATSPGGVKLALYGRRALAKDAAPSQRHPVYLCGIASFGSSRRTSFGRAGGRRTTTPPARCSGRAPWPRSHVPCSSTTAGRRHYPGRWSSARWSGCMPPAPDR